jgi:DeoR/GlpR family transcriptional regulator of sugar metabolism
VASYCGTPRLLLEETGCGGFAECRAHLCFLGPCGVDAVHGLAALHYEVAEVKGAMVAASGEVVVTATTEKLGTTTPFIFVPVSLTDQVVTQSTASQAEVEKLSERQVKVTPV